MNNLIQTLAARIDAANEAYRNGSPIMSDAAFDALEAELRRLDPNHPSLTRVGAVPVNGAWPKVAHTIPMGSLNKAQYNPGQGDGHGDLRAWWPGKPVCITHKLDGISLSLQYHRGRLVQALTRGDGTTGEDITRNVLLMKGAVKQLPPGLPNTVFVRGEIVCRKSDFKAHFPGESNPRNTAAGTSKRQTGHEKCQHLTVVAYQFLPNGVPAQTKTEELVQLGALGFVVPPYYHVADGDIRHAIQVYGEYVKTKRDALDWEIDGLVLDINDRDDREALGEHNLRPKGAIALKFPHAQQQTTLRDVVWQVGKSGRITPVAVFDPVTLAGAQVERASLHNPDYIEELLIDVGKVPALTVGDSILAERRNDVIPGVASILMSAGGKPFTLPAHCPECHTPTRREGAYLVCPNGDACPAQATGAIKRWLSKIEVKHFGDALVELLVETGKVETIADLYTLDPAVIASLEDMNGRRLGGTATKAFNNLHAQKTLPLHVFVGSLGIPLIGRTMAKTIVDGGYDSLNKMSKAKPGEVAAIPGVGQTKAEAFCDGFWDLLDRGVITGLLVHITIAGKATGAFSGKSVCMTGFRDAKMAAAIEAQGGTLKSSVSKGLDFLVALDPNGVSGKLDKARSYGTRVVGVDFMWKLLGVSSP